MAQSDCTDVLSWSMSATPYQSGAAIHHRNRTISSKDDARVLRCHSLFTPLTADREWY
jgi:hypothetical protein